MRISVIRNLLYFICLLSLVVSPGVQASADRKTQACLDKVNKGAKVSKATFAPFKKAKKPKKKENKDSSKSNILITESIKVNLAPTTKDVVDELALRSCYIYNEADVALSIAQTSLVVSHKKFPKITVTTDKTHGTYREPGLLGLKGAEEVVRSLLVEEFIAIWVGSIDSGAPAREITDAVISAYVDGHLDAIKKNPDEAISIKLRLWERIEDAVLSGRKLTADEQTFIRSFQGYMRKQYVRMADVANQKYREYQAKKDATSSARVGLSNLIFTGHAPYDPLEEMKTTLMMSGKAATTLTSMVGAVGKRFSSSAMKLKSLDAGGQTYRQALKDVTTNYVKQTYKAMGKNAGSKAIAQLAKVGGKLASSLGTKAINAVPVVGQIIDVIVTSVDTAVKISRNKKIEKKLREARAHALKEKYDLKSMFNTRDGAQILRYFYAKATSSSSPDSVEKKIDLCRACFYTDKNYKGEEFCTSGRESDLRNLRDSKNKKFNNRVRSIKIFGDKSCESPAAILHENQRHTGDKIVLRGSEPDLSKVKRGKNHNWDKDISSVEYRKKGDDLAACEACFYTKKSYKGSKVCISEPNANLHDLGVGDRVSAIKFNTKVCPEAKLWVYQNKNYKRNKSGRGVKALSKNTSRLDKDFNNRISSAYFSPKGVNPNEQKAEGGCRVCLYKHASYKGDYICLNVNDKIADLSKYKAGGETYKMINAASSAQFITDSCPKGSSLELELFNRKNFKNKRVIVTSSTKNLASHDFNDLASSAKLTSKSKKKLASACEVCMYTKPNYKGDRKCRGVGKTKLKDIKFNNKPASIKFSLNGCPKGGATFYENNYEGDEFTTSRNIKNLGEVKRGKKGNFYRNISSLKFSGQLGGQAAAAKKAKAAAAKKCQVCLYADAGYKGKKFCSGPANVSDLKKHGLRNKVSSVQIKGKSCGKARLTIYEDPKYKSYSRIVTRSISDLKGLKMRKGGKKSFNNDMASFKFSN